MTGQADPAATTLRALALRVEAARRLALPAGSAVLRSIVEATVALFDAEAASIALFDPTSGRLVFEVAAGEQGQGVVGLAIDPVTFEPVGVADGEYYRLLTSAFLHGGVLHILFNVLWIRQLGPEIANLYGPGRMVLIYTVSGIVGFTLSSLLYFLDIPFFGAGITVGASFLISIPLGSALNTIVGVPGIFWLTAGLAITGMIILILLVILMLPVTTNTAFAATIVVNPGGGGNFNTIQAAINNASPGDTIAIRPGTYSENLNLSLMGSAVGGATGDLNLVAVDGPGTAVLSGSGVKLTQSGAFNGSLIIDGLRFSTTNEDGIRLTSVTSLIVVNSTFDPIGSDNTQHNALELTLSNSAPNVAVYNNTFRNIANDAVVIVGQGTSQPTITIAGNTISDDGTNGNTTDQAISVEMRDNTNARVTIADNTLTQLESRAVVVSAGNAAQLQASIVRNSISTITTVDQAVIAETLNSATTAALDVTIADNVISNISSGDGIYLGAVGTPDVLGHRALVAPALPAHGLLRRRVERRDAPVDAVGAELLERLRDGEPLRLTAHTPAANLLADHGPELGGQLAAQAIQSGEADGLGVALDLDRPLAVLAVGADRGLGPAAGVLLAERVADLHQRGGRLAVVEPAMDRGRVLGPEGPDPHLDLGAALGSHRGRHRSHPGRLSPDRGHRRQPPA